MPAVREWLDEVVGGWPSREVREDALLVATELATNAVLHSGGPAFEVAVTADAAGVVVVVEDRGGSAAASISHRSEMAVHAFDDDLVADSSTGRGLLLVSTLASAWGTEDLGSGTRVWAAFRSGEADHPARPPEVQPGSGHAQDDGVRVIELRGCPPDLLLAHDANLADTARELRLFGATHGDTATVDAAERVAEIVRVSAVYWDAARLAAHRAIRSGAREVDIATAPEDWQEVPANIAVLRHAVGMAEDLMARGLLITLPAPAPVQEWRDWVEVEMVEQVTLGRDPVRLAEWQAQWRSQSRP